MALINCSECGKEVSDKAAACPSCGNPINPQPATLQEEYLSCPNCGSKNLHSDKKGFSGGKALAGAVLTGGIGLLAGTIGSKDIQITCLKCGKKFKTGEAIVVKPNLGNATTPNDLDKLIKEKIEQEGMLQAVHAFKAHTGYDLTSSKRHVDKFAKDNNIIPKSTNGGCAGVIVIFIILTGTLCSVLI